MFAAGRWWLRCERGTGQEAGSLNCKAFPGRPDWDFIENQTKKKNPCFVRDKLYFVPTEKKGGRANRKVKDKILLEKKNGIRWTTGEVNLCQSFDSLRLPFGGRENKASEKVNIIHTSAAWNHQLALSIMVGVPLGSIVATISGSAKRVSRPQSHCGLPWRD